MEGRTHADARLNEMLDDHSLRAQARAATYRTGSQIDNWLVDEEIDACTLQADVIPGVSGKDHSAVVMKYCPNIEVIGDRTERPVDPTVTKLAKKLRDNQHNEEGQRLRDLLADRARDEWECGAAELAEDAGWDERLRTL